MQALGSWVHERGGKGAGLGCMGGQGRMQALGAAWEGREGCRALCGCGVRRRRRRGQEKDGGRSLNPY